MENQTVQEKIEELEMRMFMLNMKDHMDRKDFQTQSDMSERLKELKSKVQ